MVPCGMQGCTPWNIGVVEEVLGQGMDPTHLAKALDHTEFTVVSGEAFVLLMRLWTSVTGSASIFPLETVLSSPWKNAKGQLAFLRWATSISAPSIDFHSSRHWLDLGVTHPQCQ